MRKHFKIPATSVTREIEFGFNTGTRSGFISIIGKQPAFICSFILSLPKVFTQPGRIRCSTHEAIHGRRWMLVRSV